MDVRADEPMEENKMTGDDDVTNANNIIEPGPSENPTQTDHSFLFLRAMQFDLVVEEILRNLNFEDVKALSRVSKDCLTAVRKTSLFENKAKVLICKEVIRDRFPIPMKPLGILEGTTYLWKNISLDLSLPVQVIDLISDILERATFLSLRLPTSSTTNSDEDMMKYLTAIFQKTKGLRELELDVVVMNKILHDFFSSVEVQQVIGKLESLDIRGDLTKPSSVYYYLHDLDSDEDDDDDDPIFQRNFLQLSLLPLKLKRFALGKIDSIKEADTKYMKFIPNIVRACANTLEELELHLQIWNFEDMKVIRCPKLKRLILSCNASSASIVETFIKNQPPLEELVLETKVECPINLLLCLQGMLGKMKKFHLKVKSFTGTKGLVDWSFLKGMSHLKQFYIRKPYYSDEDDVSIYGSGEGIIEKLPESLYKISVLGLDNFWDTPQDDIGILLSRFVNLTQLDLIRSKGAVTDKGLQTLIRKFPNLTSLAFSHCHEVTDFGISGILKNDDGEVVEQGVSLLDFAGLLHLKIRSCPNITPDCILSVVKFKYLRSFDYYRNVQLPKDFLLEIAGNNPCLESIALHIITYQNEENYLLELTKEIKKKNPRIHRLEILENSNWEDEDSDSDAEDIDGYPDGDGDSNFSGEPEDRDFDLDYDDDYNESDDYDADAHDYDYGYDDFGGDSDADDYDF